MKINQCGHFFLGRRLSFLLGTTPKTIFPGDLLFLGTKTKTINRNKHSVQLANTCEKNFGATKLKSQPNTPEIQRLSLSLIKPFLLGRRNYHFISTAKMYKRLLKTD